MKKQKVMESGGHILVSKVKLVRLRKDGDRVVDLLTCAGRV